MPPLKFSIMPMVMVEITDGMADRPIFFRYFDDNKKNIFKSGCNNGHGQKHYTETYLLEFIIYVPDTPSPAPNNPNPMAP